MNKTPSEKTKQLLNDGREAAIRCVEVVREFYEASRIENEQDLPEYGPYITRLYKTLQTAWAPSLTCWPELLEEFKRGFRLRAETRNLAAPVSAWITAADVFWVAVVGTVHYETARKAWEAWSDDSVPVVEDGNVNRDASVATCVHIRRLLSAYGEEARSEGPWLQWIAEIQAAEPDSPHGTASGVAVPDKPTLPAPRKPLPQARDELTALLQRTDEFILLLRQAALEGKLAFTSRWAAIKMDDLGLQIDTTRSNFAPPLSQLLVLHDELEPYLDPLVERASWHQVVAWYEVFAQMNEVGRSEPNTGSPSTTPRLKTLRTGLGTGLTPYGLLREQILTAVDHPDAIREYKGYLPVSEMAIAYGIPKDALAKRLERWREKQPDGWIEAQNPKRGGPRYYYEQSAIRPIIEEMMDH